MAVLACAYGVLRAGSIWYPINLLAATVYAQSLKLGPAQLNSFHSDSFAIALILHGIGSIFVGLLYGAMLPMFARRPIVLGGLIAPVLWSGLLYSIMELLNPLLASRINWFWFMVSQIAFGVVAGIVVVRQERVSTRENLPFVLRAGIEVPGTVPQRKARKSSREGIPASLYVCAPRDFPCRVRRAPRPATKWFRSLGTERSLGVWPSLLGKLRRLSRCGRKGRGCDRACQSCLSGYRG